jgi:hypothetical protein
MKTHTLLGLLLLLGASLYGQKTASAPFTKTMAQTFVAAVQADPGFPSEKIIIIVDGLCSEQDCKAIFDGLPVEIYLREELFMRNLNSYYKLGEVRTIEEDEKWQLSFIYLISGGRATIPGTITGTY